MRVKFKKGRWYARCDDGHDRALSADNPADPEEAQQEAAERFGGSPFDWDEN